MTVVVGVDAADIGLAGPPAQASRHPRRTSLAVVLAVLAAGCADREEPPKRTAGDAGARAPAPAAAARVPPAVDGGPLTLARCVDIALGRNLAIARARAALAVARADRDLADAAAWPRLDAAGAWSDRSNEPAIAFGGAELAITDRQRRVADLRLEVPLLNAGDTPGRRAAAARGTAAAAADSDRVRQEVELAVETAYFDLLGARARAATAGRALAAAQAQGDSARDRAAHGLGLETEALAADARAAQREEEGVHAGHAVADARARLAWAMGLEPTASLEPVEPDDAPPPDVAADDALLALARLRRPDLRAAAERVAQAEAEVRAAAGGELPALSTYGAWRLDADSHLVHHEWLEAGVEVTVPLYDRTAAATVERARRRLAQQRLEAAQREQDVALELRRARLALADAAAAAPVARRAAEVAARRLAEVRDQYRQGLAEVASALLAESEAADADARSAQARYAWRVAYARLRHAIGGGEVPAAAPGKAAP